jgi:CheY-like chemotaxis protein
MMYYMRHTTPARILLVEDHDDSRIILALLLRRGGYEVTAVATKADAIRACRGQAFDLLIGDVQLPDGSGLDLMREIAEICHIKGIAYTGFGYEKDIADAHAAGYSAHLLKPADVKKIFDTIERTLSDSPANSATIRPQDCLAT